MQISPTSKALSSLSQPTLDKFEKLLAKIVPSPTRQTASMNEDKTDPNITIVEFHRSFALHTTMIESFLARRRRTSDQRIHHQIHPSLYA